MHIVLVVLLFAATTTSLDDVTRDFVSAFIAGDVQRLMQLWSADSPSKQADRKRIALLLQDRVEFEPVLTSVHRDESTATATLELRSRSSAETTLESYSVAFRRRNGEWQVTRFAATDPNKPRELARRGAAQLEAGDAQSALKSYTHARELAEQAGDTTSILTAERGLGSVALARGNVADAENHFVESMKLAEAAHDPRAKGKALLVLARLNDRRGENAAGHERATEALDIFRAAHDRAGESSALNMLANLQLSTGDYAAAKTLFTDAMNIDRDLNNTVGVAIALNDLGIINRRQSNYREAIQDFRKALQLSREADDVRGVADALGNLGNVFNVQGNYLEALHAYEESIAVNERLGEMVNLAAALTGVGEMYTSLGNYAQAAKFHSRTYALMKRLQFKEGMSIALHNLGEVAAARGHTAAALDYYKRSLKLDTESHDRAGIVIDLGDIGQAQLRTGEVTNAAKTFAKAIHLAEELGDRETMIAALTNRSELESKLHRNERALADLHHARKIADEIGNRNRSWQVRMFAARVLRAMGRRDDARHEDEQAIAIIEELRRAFAEPETAARAFETMVGPYQDMVGILVEQKNVDEAFRYAERAKARVLLDVLRGGRANITTTMTAAERARESELLAVVTQLNRDSRETNADVAAAAKLHDARLAYSEFLDALYAAHPELAVRRGDATPIGRDGLAAITSANAADALLEFVVADDRTYVFVFNGSELHVHTVSVSRDDLQNRVARFRAQLAHRDPSYGASSRALYELLLRGAASDIANAKTICIVPDGALWELPFQALQRSPGHFILDDSAVFYVPSLTVLHEMVNKSGRTRAQSRLVAFANPVVATDMSSRLRSVYRGLSLAPIPDAETEVRTIAALYPQRAAVYVEADAREETAKREAPAFNILHFATHGILDDQNALYSRLVFSPPVATDEDGLLEAREIMQLDLHADLAVLSACETARGRAGAGEGLIGMSWAFFVAGCATTVASQWEVDSAATSDLMIAFHKHLQATKGQTADALRAAALSLRRKPAYRHPYYWAAFVVIGESQ